MKLNPKPLGRLGKQPQGILSTRPEVISTCAAFEVATAGQCGGLGSQNASWNQSRAPRAAPRCGIVVCIVPATSRLRRHPARNCRRNCVGPGLEVDPGPIADSDTEHSAAAGCQCPRVRARDCRCRALEPSTLALPPSWPMRGMRPAPASPDSPYPLQAPSSETATGSQGRSHVPSWRERGR